MRKISLIVFLFLSFSLFPMNVEENKNEKETVINVENKFIKVEFTTSGGRIKSLIDKKLNKNLIFWSPGEGGGLDDRGIRTMADYQYKIVKEGKDKVEIIFTYLEPSNIHWEKRIKIEDNFPAIDVQYIITNRSNKKFEFEHMVRNFVIPGGDKFEGDDHIIFHSSKGVEKIVWKEIWLKNKSGSFYVNDVAENWQAIYDEENKLGLIVIFGEISKLYYWSKAGEWGTMEWIYPKVELNAGEKVSFDAKLVVTDDLPGYTYATKDYIISLLYSEKNKKFDAEIFFKPLFSEGKNVKIETKILDKKRNFLFDIEPVEFKSTGDINNLKFSFNVPGDELYIFQQEIFFDKEKNGWYEIPIIAGFVETSQIDYTHPKFSEKEEELIELRISKEDLNRGYFLSLPGEGKDINSIKKLQIDVGIEEGEFLEIGCMNFKEIGNTEIKIEKSDYPGEIKIFVDENYRMIEKDNFIPKVGGRNRIFIKFEKVKNIKPGEYPVEIVFKPENSEETKVKMKLKVWPVKFEEVEDTYSTFFWSSFECIFSTLYPDVKEKKRQLQIWEMCLNDMRNAGQKILEIRPQPLKGKNVLKEYIKVKEFKDGYLPVLALENWKEILDIAKKYGMEHIIFRYGWYHEDWLPPDFKNFPDEKKNEVEIFILKQLYSFLKKNGFKRIFVYFIDELDPAKVEKVCERMKTIKNAIPDIEFAGSGFASTPLEKMEQLSDYLTWIAPYFSIYNVYDWIKEKKLKILPETIIATQLSGDHSQEYFKLRMELWKLWKAGLNGYQIYGYYTFYPKHKYSCVFPDSESPISSPALFALIDGWEDFQYLWEVNKKINGIKNKEKKLKIMERLNLLVGESEKSILKWKFTSSGSFVFPVISGELEDLLKAKREILEILTEEAK